MLIIIYTVNQKALLFPYHDKVGLYVVQFKAYRNVIQSEACLASHCRLSAIA